MDHVYVVNLGGFETILVLEKMVLPFSAELCT